MSRSRTYMHTLYGLVISAGMLAGCGSDSPTPPATTYTISGKVTATAAESVEGVVVTVGSRKDTTDQTGAWSLSGLEPGAYTISPAKTGNTFTPPTRAITVASADVTGQDFVIAGDVVAPSHPEMIAVQPGSFMLGGTKGLVGGGGIGGPKHQVTLTRSYLIAETETTQEQFARVMGFNPSRDTVSNGAVSCMTINEIVEYCNKLSDAEGLQRAYTISGSDVSWDRNANGYRLPTNAEWEYAARAGDTNNTYNGYYDSKNPSSVLDEIAWYRFNTSTAPDYLPQNAKPQPVRLKRPNAWGLYDVLGNLFEVVIDGFAEYTPEPVVDPYVPKTADTTIVRGGSCISVGGQITLSGREIAKLLGRESWTSGFRVARFN
jgi:formylglycine-generating enzyme